MLFWNWFEVEGLGGVSDKHTRVQLSSHHTRETQDIRRRGCASGPRWSKTSCHQSLLLAGDPLNTISLNRTQTAQKSFRGLLGKDPYFDNGFAQTHRATYHPDSKKIVTQRLQTWNGIERGRLSVHVHVSRLVRPCIDCVRKRTGDLVADLSLVCWAYSLTRLSRFPVGLPFAISVRRLPPGKIR